jgi:hypothetical protein
MAVRDRAQEASRAKAESSTLGRGTEARAPETLKRQRSLSLSPIDDLEHHAPSKHFRFQVRCVFLSSILAYRGP